MADTQPTKPQIALQDLKLGCKRQEDGSYSTKLEVEAGEGFDCLLSELPMLQDVGGCRDMSQGELKSWRRG